MKDTDSSAILDKAAEACDRIGEAYAGMAGTCNDWKRKVQLDASAATAKECAINVRAIKTELASPAGEPSK